MSSYRRHHLIELNFLVHSLKEQVDNINLKSTLSEQLDICTKKKAWMEFEELFIKFKEIEEDLKKGNE